MATADIEGAYLAIDMRSENVLVVLDPIQTSIVVALVPELEIFVTEEGTMYAYLGRALYGCIQSAKLFHEDLSGTLEDMGFIRNPYDPCLMNFNKQGKQVTVAIYVDDVKISSTDKELVDWTLRGLTARYKTLTIKRGTQHEYLGIDIDYTKKGEVTLSMEKMVRNIVDNYDYHGSEKVANSPATNDLFQPSVGEEASVALCDREREEFHSLVAKLLYVAKRTRPDILTSVSYLTTRVKEPNVGDQKKLERLMRYLKGTISKKITIKPDDLTEVQCYIDASHGAHCDGKGHTGMVMTLGEGCIYASSKKQRLVSRSSTESELIGISDGLCQALWTRNLLKEQGYEMKPIILYQDNTSTLTLISKGRSTSERTKHVDRKYFFVHDRINAGEVVPRYKNTKEMIADIMTKPLQGTLFMEMRSKLMNESLQKSVSTVHLSLQECVGFVTPGLQHKDFKTPGLQRDCENVTPVYQ